jgi:nitric oxide reductase subunit C
MLSKSQAKMFFLVGTFICTSAFLLLTLDTFKRIPAQTHEDKLNPSAIRGKHLFESNNCMGCHTIFGEGAYYAPELTKVYERRGESFIQAMLTDPQKMYPGQRKMVQYKFSEQDKLDLIAFFKWVGEVDLNGFPAKPTLGQSVVPGQQTQEAQATLVKRTNRPLIFNQMCIACHSLEGQGGQVGPALDGVGSRKNAEEIHAWLKNPLAVKPDSKMPQLPLSEADLTELTAFLSQLKGN